MISLSFSGDRKLAEAIRKLSDASKKRIERAVIKSAFDINNDVKGRIRKGPKSGTLYFRVPGENYMTIRAGSADGPPVAFARGGGAQNLSLMHRASAPGEAPATDTGNLANKIAYKQTGPTSAEITSGDVPYALYLELGTTKIKPRPAWTPAVEAERPKFRARLEKIIREETRR